MIHFYFNAAPNPMKVALMLEETGLAYTPVPVDTKKGQQHSAEFSALNPNRRVPALIDGDVAVFDSNAILLYLAEKTGQFLPENGDLVARGQLLSWLFFIASGIGPYSGQAVHFGHIAKGTSAYALARYRYEAERHWQIIEDRLADRAYLLGAQYTILDMAVWGWAPRIDAILDLDSKQRFPNITRLMEDLDARPAAQRARELPTRFPFKEEMDIEAIAHMYPTLHALKGAGASS